MVDVNMAELFARDPRDHTDADIKKIIAELREQRSKFIVDGGRPKAAAKQPTAAQAALVKLDLDLKL